MDTEITSWQLLTTCLFIILACAWFMARQISSEHDSELDEFSAEVVRRAEAKMQSLDTELSSAVIAFERRLSPAFFSGVKIISGRISRKNENQGLPKSEDTIGFFEK